MEIPLGSTKTLGTGRIRKRQISIDSTSSRKNQSPTQRRRVRARKPTFFDLLAADELEIIVRHVSTQPRLEHWARHISSNDLRMLFLNGGPLTTVASSMFRALEVGSMEAQEWPPSTEWKDIHPLRMEDSTAAQGAISAITTDLKHMTLSNVRARTLRTVTARSGALECLELRGTEFNECALESLLRECGPRTAALRISGVRNYMTAVRKHWPLLRDLHLFNIENSIFSNATFWRTVGPSLERLTLSVRTCGRHNMRSIRKHCSRLRAISVQSRESLHPCVADFVASYGAQLKHVSLTHMDNRFFAKIGIECTKATFEFEFDYDGSLVKVLPIIGKRLVKASIFVFHMRFATPLIDASKTCVVLKTLRVVDDMKASVLQALMLHAGRELEVLDIFGLFKTGPSMVEAVAKGTGKLRRFCYHGYAPPKGVFAPLVKANPHLEHVIFHIGYFGFLQVESMSIAQTILVDLVQTFSEAAALRSLIVPVVMGVRKKRFQEVSDACQVFRFRNVHVELLELDYFT